VAIPACIAVYAAATMAVGCSVQRTSRWLVQLVARELGSGQAAAPVERSPTSYLNFQNVHTAPERVGCPRAFELGRLASLL
jgi:hypothetical protein